MGATLDETRVELEAQRARVRATAENLETTARRTFDIRARIRRDPVRAAAVVGGLAFVLLGGPRRSVRFVRRAVVGQADAERAYAALPSTLRTFVDETAPRGPGRDEARGELALALHAWRENPKNRKRAERLVSETLTPPGPERAFWQFAEAVGVAVAALVARQIMARSLMGGGTKGTKARNEAGAATAPSVATASTAPSSVPVGPDAKPTPNTAQYAGWSGRRPSTAGPAGKDAAPASSAAVVVRTPVAEVTTTTPDANGDRPA